MPVDGVAGIGLVASGWYSSGFLDFRKAVSDQMAPLMHRLIAISPHVSACSWRDDNARAARIGILYQPIGGANALSADKAPKDTSQSSGTIPFMSRLCSGEEQEAQQVTSCIHQGHALIIIPLRHRRKPSGRRIQGFVHQSGR